MKLLLFALAAILLILAAPVRYLVALTVTAILIATIVVSSAGAWHAADVKVTSTCVNGTWQITATITQSGQWPGAYVKTVTPASLPGSFKGVQQVDVVVGWPNSNETQKFVRQVDTQNAPACKVVCDPIVVEKIVPGPERIVYVDRVVEKRVEVPVEKIVERVVEKPVTVTKTVYVVRYKTRWKTRTVVRNVYRTKVIHDRCPPPPVCCVGKG